MGATVVRLEEEQRLDIYRRNGPFQFGTPHREKAAYYLFANYNKRSVYRRVEDDPTFAPSVVAWADMVLENLGRRRLDRLGIGTPDAPKRMMVSVSGFGRTGPCADYKAYAPNVHCFAGLAGAVHELSDPEATIRTSLADYCVALWSATLSAAWWLGGAEPNLFDLSMAEVIATKLEGLPLDASRAKDVADGQGLILRCTDGSVAVATGLAAYGEALAAVGVDLDKAPISASAVAVSADLTAAGRGVADVLEAADRAGFAAYEVLKPAGIIADAQLGSRIFLLPLEHPAAGKVAIFALPWKVAGSRRDDCDSWYRRSPLLGEDDDWIDAQLQRASEPLEGAPQ
jgi:crotonobetainyl-CoA:carnitine CoA-transferase CaiB-like acyl-CoA transferase